MRNFKDEQPTRDYFSIYRTKAGLVYYSFGLDVCNTIMAIYGSCEGRWCYEEDLPEGAVIHDAHRNGEVK